MSGVHSGRYPRVDSSLYYGSGRILVMLSIILNDFRILLKNKIALTCLILIPPALIAILSAVMAPIFGTNSFVKTFTIAIVNYDDSIGTNMAIQSLDTKDYISNIAKIKYLKEDEALEQLKNAELAGAVIIPDGFATSLYEGTNKPLKVYTNGKQGINSEMVKSFFKSAGDLVIAGQSSIYTVYDLLVEANLGRDEAYSRTMRWMSKLVLLSMGRNGIFEKEVVSDMPQINPVQYYAVGVSVMFIMFAGILGVRLITQDYESGIMNRILISPIRRLSYMAAKLATIMILGIIQFIMIVVPASFFFSTSLSIFNIPLLLTVVSVVFTSASLYILISTLARNTANATTACIISTFIIGLVGGCIYPVASMADSLKIASEYVFSSWAIRAISLAVTGGDLNRILNICAVVLSFGIAFVVISMVVVKRRELKFF